MLLEFNVVFGTLPIAARAWLNHVPSAQGCSNMQRRERDDHYTTQSQGSRAELDLGKGIHHQNASQFNPEILGGLAEVVKAHYI